MYDQVCSMQFFAGEDEVNNGKQIDQDFRRMAWVQEWGWQGGVSLIKVIKYLPAYKSIPPPITTMQPVVGKSMQLCACFKPCMPCFPMTSCYQCQVSFLWPGRSTGSINHHSFSEFHSCLAGGTPRLVAFARISVMEFVPRCGIGKTM